MTKTELSAYRRLLEKSVAQSAGTIDREALAIDTSPDELDRIQHANDREQAISSLERSSSRRREIQSALHRMDRGEFGICMSCEKEINPRRLAAVPWTSHCIQCQEIAERELQSDDSRAGVDLESALALA